MSVISGLQLPYLSEPDPELAGEGSLDPLGLAMIADRLADAIAPGITARMARIRFVTAIAAGSAATYGLADEVMPADGVTPPYLAFEWHLVEALAKDRSLPSGATAQVPGIQKARSAIGRGDRLEARTYLKVPKVFGFFGIYKRLARFGGVVDDALVLQERGYRLLKEWEREQGLDGFADRKRGTAGARFSGAIETAVRNALTEGQVVLSPRAWLWSRLVSVLRPDTAGSAERRQLRALLQDPNEPIRRELVQGVARFRDGSEREVLKALRSHSSTDLRIRIDAITGYERVAGLLLSTFDVARRVSTARGTVPVSPLEISRHPLIVNAAEQLPGAFDQAVERLERVGLAEDIEWVLGRFRSPMPAAELVEEVLAHHEHVQAAKPPGKRPWFDRDSRGFLVRLGYELREEPSTPLEFIHPYRVNAVRSFLSDLR